VLFLATATSFVHFAKLPDAAVIEVGEVYKLSGDRKAVLHGLQELMLRCTYAELDPIFIVLKQAADKHGVPDAVRHG
jgi:hypothetical protein